MQTRYVRQVEKSQTLLLNEQSRLLEHQGKTVYKLGFGQSPFLPPADVIDSLKGNAGRKDYSPVQGIAELREAVAHFHHQVDKLDVEATDVLIAPGSKMLIYAIMTVFTKADVLVPSPSWVSYVPQAHLANHQVIPIVTDYASRWRVTPEALEKAVRAKKQADVPTLLILNYPGNPDGLTYTGAELKALADVARKHNILIISDEIYGLLHHSGEHESIARHYPEGTIVTTGLSKWCGAGGWRLGVALLPKSLEGGFKDTLLGIASETYSCAPTPVQMAACEAYRPTPERLEYVAHQRRILSAIGMACYHKLHNSGIGVRAPQGGFYMFLDFSNCGKKAADSHALCAKLLADTGVAILPGEAFGMPPAHLSARMAYVDFDGASALKDSEKIGLNAPLDDTFLTRHAARTLEGIDRLCDWAKAA